MGSVGVVLLGAAVVIWAPHEQIPGLLIVLHAFVLFPGIAKYALPFVYQLQGLLELGLLDIALCLFAPVLRFDPFASGHTGATYRPRRS